jgi:hypothetical protein
MSPSATGVPWTRRRRLRADHEEQVAKIELKSPPKERFSGDREFPCRRRWRGLGPRACRCGLTSVTGPRVRQLTVGALLDSPRAVGVLPSTLQARSSVVEHYLDTVGVVGSTPIAPTNRHFETGGLIARAVSPSSFPPPAQHHPPPILPRRGRGSWKDQPEDPCEPVALLGSVRGRVVPLHRLGQATRDRPRPCTARAEGVDYLTRAGSRTTVYRNQGASSSFPRHSPRPASAPAPRQRRGARGLLHGARVGCYRPGAHEQGAGRQTRHGGPSPLLDGSVNDRAGDHAARRVQALQDHVRRRREHLRPVPLPRHEARHPDGGGPRDRSRPEDASASEERRRRRLRREVRASRVRHCSLLQVG